jgi:TPP-dependent pyruvate/acetoin dehydrogenase alpha subunit
VTPPSAAKPALGADSNLSWRIYQSLFLIRKSEECIIRHYPEDEMKTPMHMSMGQEAISVGVCAAVGDSADVFNSYRSHAPFLARTGNVKDFFAELYGRATGPAGGKAGSMHLSDISAGHLCSTAIVSSGIPVAIGAAYAAKARKTGRTAVAFFGDGAVDEGDFWESLNIACAMKLPMVFVCEDNGLAVHTPKSMRHGYRSIPDVVRQFDCVVEADASNDAERIFQVTQQALDDARRRSCPAFLVFQCYRYLEHVGVNYDFHEGYRDEVEYRQFMADKDCLKIQRHRLIEGGATEPEIAAAEAEIEARVEEAVALAKQAPFPPLSDLYKGVFHEAD